MRNEPFRNRAEMAQWIIDDNADDPDPIERDPQRWTDLARDLWATIRTFDDVGTQIHIVDEAFHGGFPNPACGCVACSG